MATARERLRQLSIAQEAHEDEMDRISVQPRFDLPRGGGILVRPVRPSASEGVDPNENTPLTDFGEFFLNQIGISSPRQRLARTETLAAIHSANQTIIQAVEEQAANIEARGLGGADVEFFRNNKIQQAKAAELMDSPDPTIQEYGRAAMLAVADSYDQMNKDYAANLANVKGQVTARLNNFVDLGRAEASANDSIISQLNEYGKRNGIDTPLPSLIKQALSDYIGGTPFNQKGGESRGMLENVPGFNVVYDPSEEITVGNAAALVAAVKRERERTIATSMAKEMEVATRAGFRLLDKDGRLTAEEIAVSELEPDISKLMMSMPEGWPFTIRPAVPNANDARCTAQSTMDIAGATAGKYKSAIEGLGPIRNFTRGLEVSADKMTELEDGLRRVLGETPEEKRIRKARPTND